MWKKYKFWGKTKNFQNKIYASLVLTSLLTMGLLSLLIGVQSLRLYQNNKNEIISNNVEQLKNNLQARVDAINNGMDLLMYNPGLSNFFDFPPQSVFDKYVAMRDIFDPAVNNVLGMNRMIEEVYFYTDKEDLTFRSNIAASNLPDSPDWVKNFRQKVKHQWFFKNKVINVVDGLPFSTSDNVIQFEIDEKQLFKDLISEQNKYAYAIIDDNRVIYSSDNFKKLKLGFKTTTKAPIENLKIEFYTDNKSLRAFTLSSLSLVFIFFLLGIVMTLIVAKVLSRQILERVSILKHKVISVSTNNFNVNFATNDLDEMGELSNLIGEMMRRIEKLIHEVYQTTIDKQTSEYKALTNQINSHFLYNTLSVMNWRAMMVGQEDLSEAIQTLSKYYRTTLNQGKSEISLRNELENVQTYLDLQLFLNPSRFTYVFNIDEKLLETQVINLMLQPIVENAIEHGFENKVRDAKIFIQVRKVNRKDFTIQVIDNGEGMLQKDIKKALTNKSKGYGLKNIDQRIKFYFGKEYGMKIYSIKSQGTKIELLLPLKYD